MPLIQLTHGPVAYAQLGQGRPALLLHANPGDHRDFEAIAGELARDHRVIAVDWPGYGQSPPLDPPRSASAPRFAEIAIELADALRLQGALVIGNSVGGFAGAKLALARPEAVGALVLVDSGGFGARHALARAFCAIKGREWVTRSIALRFAQLYLRVRNEHTAAILARTAEGARIPERVAVDAALWRSFGQAEHDLRAHANQIAVPTLIAWGKHDPVLPLKRDGRLAARLIPGAELAEFETGHMPFAEDPLAFLEVLRAFLARLPVRAVAA